MGLRSKIALLGEAANRARAASAFPDFPFCLAFFTDGERVAHPELVIRAMPPGSAIVFRDYSATRRVSMGHRLFSIAKARGILFLVAGDVELARAIGADGLHVPSWQIRNHEGVAGSFIVTTSCHSADDLVRARHIGATAAFFSPVFPTISHPESKGLGASQFNRMANQSPIPVLALGGVTASNARLLRSGNLVGLGAIGELAPW